MATPTYRIPLDTAHQFLATFGITKPSREYERWVKEDGFDLKDFSDVLFESPYVFTVDWRACLQHEVEVIARVLALLNVQLATEFDEDGDSGSVRCGSANWAAVAYRPVDASKFDDVVRAIQSVVPAGIEFRADATNRGRDTWN